MRKWNDSLTGHDKDKLVTFSKILDNVNGEPVGESKFVIFFIVIKSGYFQLITPQM